MRRNAFDLVLLAVIAAGGVFAWRAGRERALLSAHYGRLVAAAGELPVEDPALVYLKALDTGEPLHFAWRVHLPPRLNLEARTKTGGGWSGGTWTTSAEPLDFIARVRLREDERGLLNVYAKSSNGSSRSGFGSTALARLLREHASELKIEQVGRPGVAAIDPKAGKPTVLLRVALPESLRDEVKNDLPSQFFPNLVELTIGPPGSLP